MKYINDIPSVIIINIGFVIILHKFMNNVDFSSFISSVENMTISFWEFLLFVMFILFEFIFVFVLFISELF